MGSHRRPLFGSTIDVRFLVTLGGTDGFSVVFGPPKFEEVPRTNSNFTFSDLGSSWVVLVFAGTILGRS